jgi:hypothetical protein
MSVQLTVFRAVFNFRSRMENSRLSSAAVLSDHIISMNGIVITKSQLARTNIVLLISFLVRRMRDRKW